MKKLLASAAALALIVTGSIASVPTVAKAEPYGSFVAHYCQDNAASFGLSTGECVSYIQTYYVKVCQDIKEAGLLEYYGFKSQGDCVSYVRSVL